MNPETAFVWRPILGMAINTVGVMLVIELLKFVAPVVRRSVPWLLPVAAMLAGPVLSLIQSALADWLGVPIDLSPLVAIATGGTAVAVHQIGVQSRA